MAASATYTTINGMLFHEERGGVETFYTSDPLGSLVEARDSSGALKYSAEYWPYGEVQTETGTNPSPWGFVGLLGYLKDLAGLLYVRARHYRPGLTRWQTVDLLLRNRLNQATTLMFPGIRSYSYCFERPTQGSDKSGLAWILPLHPYPFFDGDGIAIGSPGMFIDYHYGHYCGAKNPAPGDNTCYKSKDCIDEACKKHDDCTRDMTLDQFFNAVNCHCELAADAQKCGQGCLGNHSPGIIGYLECVYAASDVAVGYGLFCVALQAIKGAMSDPVYESPILIN